MELAEHQLRRIVMDIAEISLGITVALLEKLDYEFKFSDDKEARTGQINTLADIGARLYKATMKRLNEP
jgi:hypothetical protein